MSPNDFLWNYDSLIYEIKEEDSLFQQTYKSGAIVKHIS